jgi:hypothetical protein
VKGLPSGYHLLRAFLLLPDDDGNGWLCVKSPVAYVEAELFVERPVLPPTRSVSPPLLAVGGNEPMGSLCCSGFMFGQPSLCFLTPRDSVAADKLTAVVVDFFVSNCLIGEVAPGYVTVPCMSCASESVVMSCVTVRFRIKVVVNDVVVGVLSSWTAFALTGLGDQRGKLSIQLLLVNPAGAIVPAAAGETRHSLFRFLFPRRGRSVSALQL